jgi:hypothetical protein
LHRLAAHVCRWLWNNPTSVLNGHLIAIVQYVGSTCSPHLRP